MSVPSAEEFYENLRKTGRCRSIGCLYADSWSRDACELAWKQWQESGNQGIFPYIDERKDILLSPFEHRPWARSMLVFSFLPEEDPRHPLLQLPPARKDGPRGLVAGYAMEMDYHLTGRKNAGLILEELGRLYPGEQQTEWGVDASPVWEKQAAFMAGIGRQGWNGLLYDDVCGSQIHLGTIFLEAELPRRKRVFSGLRCPECRHCETGCPGHALLGHGQISVERCLSWLTGEKHGSLSWEDQCRLQNHVFGCSFCTTGCPGIPRILPEDYALDPEAVLLMPGRQLEKILQGTALQHMGASRLKRNCAGVLGVFLNPAGRDSWRRQNLKKIGSPMVRETILNWPGEQGRWQE